MDHSTLFSPEEIDFLSDKNVFPLKAKVSVKIRTLLEQLHVVFKEELQGRPLICPAQFNIEAFQFVKGEHLEDFPYQYLDFPRFFSRNEKFSFRSLFWWGHHMAFSLILEGGALRRYKENLINRYADIADRGITISLGGTLWEWKQGPGLTLDLTRERKPEIAAVLANRPFFKLTRFVSFDRSVLTNENLLVVGQDAFRTILPVITP